MAGCYDRVAGLEGHFHYPEKKGYSGVGIYTRKSPSAIVCGIGNAAFDAAGRYVEARFDDPGPPHSPNLSVISATSRAVRRASTGRPPSTSSSR